MLKQASGYRRNAFTFNLSVFKRSVGVCFLNIDQLCGHVEHKPALCLLQVRLLGKKRKLNHNYCFVWHWMPHFCHTGGTSVYQNPPFSVTIVSRDPLSSLAEKGVGVTYSHSVSCRPPQSCTWSFESSRSCTSGNSVMTESSESWTDCGWRRTPSWWR